MLLLLLRNRSAIAYILLALACIMGYVWVKRLVATNQELGAALQTQKAATDQALEAVRESRETLERFQQALDENESVKARARQEADRLDALSRDHDLAPLARARPGLVEDRINRGSDRARCMLEQATGGPAC